MTRIGMITICAVLMLSSMPARAQQSILPASLETIPDGVVPNAEDATQPAPENGVELEGDPVADWNISNGVSVWGLAGARLILLGERMAPNGIPFNPLFTLDLDVNIGLKCCPWFYIFTSDHFWGQKPGAGVAPGAIDFSKREYDLMIGGAANYYGNLEFRAFAYSFNNLNRGNSLAGPWGYKDGVGFENRYYFGSAYSAPVETKYDVARTNFLSIGYLPTKHMIGADGIEFKPGAFARAYLTYDVLGEKLYLFGDAMLICDKSAFEARLLNVDVGAASRPFESCSGLEFRMGAENVFDVQVDNTRTLWYIGLRFIF